MSNPYRDMCAELVDKLHCYASANPHHDSDELVARARALLDQPKPLESQPDAAGGIAVNLRIDLSPESLGRLCDGLTAAVNPNGGYRAITPDDYIANGSTGDQQINAEWWLPEYGCDSLENTLDSIKGRLLAAVQSWLPTAITTTPPIKPEFPPPRTIREDLL